jgi:hypothetical protein
MGIESTMWRVKTKTSTAEIYRSSPNKRIQSAAAKPRR